MPFDADKMVVDCQTKIEQFALQHTGETFYAFAIDANLLSLNSLEQFQRTLEQYQSRWNRQTRTIESMSDMTAEDVREEEFHLKLAEKHHGLDRTDENAVLSAINQSRARQRSKGCKYRTGEGIADLRKNTGDWAYQGFAELEDSRGFDSHLYQHHYDEAMESEDGHAPQTEYAIAMTELVRRLQESNAFESLNCSDDFYVTWVDHDY